jgi:hypothetical protein
VIMCTVTQCSLVSMHARHFQQQSDCWEHSRPFLARLVTMATWWPMRVATKNGGCRSPGSFIIQRQEKNMRVTVHTLRRHVAITSTTVPAGM